MLAAGPTMTGESTGVLQLGDLAPTSGRWTMTGTGPDGQTFTAGGAPQRWYAANPTAPG
jgi:hypothetical protein